MDRLARLYSFELWLLFALYAVVEGNIIVNLTGDDQALLFSDGIEAGKSTFGNPIQLNIPEYTQMISVQGANIMSDSGILASLSNGIVTDNLWRCTNHFYNGWKIPGFDDSRWYGAFVYARNGEKPYPTIRSISSNAKWIWTSSTADQKIYCRRVIQDLTSDSLNVRSLNTSSGSLKIGWDPVDTSKLKGVHLGYRIFAWRDGSVDDVRNFVVSPRVTTGTIIHLKTFVIYNVQVLVRTSNGNEMISPVVRISTDDGVPSKAPETINAFANGKSDIFLFWSPIPRQSHNGILLGYRVFCQRTQPLPGEPVKVIESETSGTSLMIQGLAAYTNYSIQVMAYTKKGNGIKSKVIFAKTQEGEPSKAPAVTAQNSSDQSILVRWQPLPEAYAHGVILGYDVIYWEADNIRTKKAKKLSYFKTFLEIFPLKVYTFYMVQVLAFTKVGKGPASEPFKVRTGEGIPENPPENLAGVSKSSTSITITWDKLPDDLVPGILQGYSIYFSNDPEVEEAWYEEIALADETSFEITDLEKFSEYEIVICAFTDAGAGPFSDATIVQTQEDVPSLPPDNVKITDIDARSFALMWGEIPIESIHGILVGYKLRLKKSSRSAEQSFQVTKDETTYVFRDLEVFTNYTVLVAGYTVKGSGEWSQPINVQTGEDVPLSSPGNLSAKYLSSSAIQLTWSRLPASLARGVILGYTIQYSPRETNNGFMSKVVMSECQCTDAEIKYLEPYTPYMFRILAFNSKGDSPLSDFVEETTDEGVPSEAPPVYAYNTSSTSINVTWPSLEDKFVHGVLLGYKITWETADTQSAVEDVDVEASVNSLQIDDLRDFTNYLVTVRGFTKTGTGNFSSTTVSTAEPEYCSGTRTRLQNIAKNPNSPTEIRRSHSYIIQSVVRIRCENSTFSTSLAWDVYSIENTSKPIITKETKTAEFSLNRRMLPYGTYKIRFSVVIHTELRDIPISDYGYIKIVKSLLVARIAGGSLVRRSILETIVIDGSESNDPDFDPDEEDKSLLFTWDCVPEGTSKEDYKWCDGVIGRNKTVFFNTTELKANEKYSVTLTVEKGERRASYTQVLMLVPWRALSTQIRCLRNCNPKVNPSSIFVLEGKCTDESCFLYPVLYEWKIERFDPALKTWQPVSTLADMTSMGFTNQSHLSLEPDTLQPAVQYRLQVIISQGHSRGDGFYAFLTNEPPQDGACEVTPLDGYSMESEFKFSCSGFTDSDQPLAYEFSYYTVSNLKHVLYYGDNANTFSTKLPQGAESSDYEFVVKVLITDSLGAAMETTLGFQVKPPSSKEDIEVAIAESILSDEGEMSHLMKEGDFQAASRLVTSAYSAMDSLGGEMGQRKQMTEHIIGTFSQVKVNNMKSLLQVSAVLAKATENKHDVGGQSEELAVNAVEGMTAFLFDNSKGGEMDAKTMKDSGNSLINAIGNILDVASSNAVKNNDTEAKDKGSSTKRVWNLVDKVGSAMMSSKAIGEPPTVVKTPSLAMVLDRQIPSTIGKHPIQEGGTSFALPSLDVLGQMEGFESSEFIDNQMVATPFNPFEWGDGGDKVKSSVTSLDMKNAFGEPILVNNLDKDIEIYIPLKAAPSPQNDSKVELPFVKPSMLRFHRINITSEGTSFSMSLKPQNGTNQFQVFIKYKVRPTLISSDFNFTLPDVSKCSEDLTVCSLEAYSIYISSDDLQVGVYHIGIWYENKDNEDAKLSRKRRDCGGHGRVKRACVGVKDPPPTPPPKSLFDNSSNIYNPDKDIQYSIVMTPMTCLFWSTAREKWTSEGCKAGPRSKPDKLQCLCNHLTSFGGDMFVAPNPIDFDKVFLEMSRLGETGNFLVLATICFFLGLYLVAAMIARKTDKEDELVNPTRTGGSSPVIGDPDHYSQVYEVIIYTGIWLSCGTTANVTFVLQGEKGTSRPIHISNTEQKYFTRGNANQFVVYVKENLGRLVGMKVWHDNTGDNPGWLLHQIMIKEITVKPVEEPEEWHFICNRWLAVESDEGRVDTFLPVASEKEVKSFKNVFYSRTSVGFGDNHLWFSVAYRPPTSRFTRVQRVTCCLTLLFSIMVANAMFYNLSGESKGTIELGPLRLSLRQLMVGIQSGIIIAPINILILQIFRKSKIKPQKKVPEYAPTKDDGEKIEPSKDVKSGCELPWWCIYIAWLLCILVTLASAAFTFFYSLMWGKEIAGQWFTSFFISFFQDLWVVQPIKILLLGIFFALIIRKPAEYETVTFKDVALKEKTDETREHVDYEDPLAVFDSGEMKYSFRPPTVEELAFDRNIRLKQLRMYRIIAQFIAYMFFLWLLMVVCYGGRDSNRYNLARAVKENLQNQEEVSELYRDFWVWSRYFFLKNLYYTDVTAETKNLTEGFTRDATSYFVGMPRLRQLRIKKNSCRIPRMFSNIIEECNNLYKWEKEDQTPYYQPLWRPYTNKGKSIQETHNVCPRPWRYQSDKQVSGPQWGRFAFYRGGGYLAELGYNYKTALNVYNEIEYYRWLDRYTRALFVEFTVFNFNTNMSSTVTVLYEQLPTGRVYPSFQIHCFPLYEKEGWFRVMCQVLYVLVLLIMVYMEVKNMYKDGLKYFKDFWNWVEIIQVSFAITAIASTILRKIYIHRIIKRIRANPFENTGFHIAVYWEQVNDVILAILMVFVTLKILRFWKFNLQICIFVTVIRRSANALFSYLIVFLALFTAYCQFAYLVFGVLDKYKSYPSTMGTLFEMILGGRMNIVHELRDVNYILGPIFFFAFVINMTFILINVFVAILNETLETVRNLKEIPEDVQMGNFLYERISNKLFCRKPKGNESIKMLSVKVTSQFNDFSSELVQYSENATSEEKSTDYYPQTDDLKELLMIEKKRRGYSVNLNYVNGPADEIEIHIEDDDDDESDDAQEEQRLLKTQDSQTNDSEVDGAVKKIKTLLNRGRDGSSKKTVRFSVKDTEESKQIKMLKYPKLLPEPRKPIKEELQRVWSDRNKDGFPSDGDIVALGELLGLLTNQLLIDDLLEDLDLLMSSKMFLSNPPVPLVPCESEDNFENYDDEDDVISHSIDNDVLPQSVDDDVVYQSITPNERDMFLRDDDILISPLSDVGSELGSNSETAPLISDSTQAYHSDGNDVIPNTDHETYPLLSEHNHETDV